MRYTPRPKIQVPVKFIVRVREVENDQRTERSHTFFQEVEARDLVNRAETHGFYATMLKVLDRKQLERV
jgi:hypothetical protein